MTQADFQRILQARSDATLAVEAARTAEALAARALEHAWTKYLDVLIAEGETAYGVVNAHRPTVIVGKDLWATLWWVKEVDAKLATLVRPDYRHSRYDNPKPCLSWQELYLKPDWIERTHQIRLKTGYNEGTRTKEISDKDLEKLRALAPDPKKKAPVSETLLFGQMR